MNAILTIGERSYDFPLAQHSQFIMDLGIGKDDNNVAVMVGNKDQVEQAISAFQYAVNFVGLIQRFETPSAEDKEHLKALKKDINGQYVLFKKASSDNEVFDWLYPTNELMKVIHDYEKEVSVAGWYRGRELPEDFNHAFLTACIKGHEDIAKWLKTLD